MRGIYGILGTMCLAVMTATATAAEINTDTLGENGWFSDDTRADGDGTEAVGTNLISDTLTDDPEATASGTSAHDADITRQITFVPAPGTPPAGTFEGAVHLIIGATGAGKSQISHRKDDITGHGPGSGFGPGFSAEYSWYGDGTPTVTASLKFGIKTSEFGSTGVSSRTGENVWDKVLIYEPGNLNGGTSDGTWYTETIDYTTGTWWFFDRTVGAGSIGTPLTLSDMSTSATLVGGRPISTVYALMTAPGAIITSVQVGIGSGNPLGSVYVNQVETNVYRAGDVTTFGPAGDLTLEATNCEGDIDGSAGHQVAVEVWMRELDRSVTGFQAFVSYDDAALSYRGDLSSYSALPFGDHIQLIGSAEVAPGEIRIDGSISPPGSGTTTDSLLATLVFDVVDECDTEFTFDLGQPFPSELSFEGNAIPTTLVDSGTVTYDLTPPVIFCPDDVTIECDESTAPGNTGEPAFAQGFEDDREGWFDFGGTLTRVPSGTNGVTSADGAWHAETTGAFTRWGGYNSVFPTGGYTTSLDIYLDVSGGYPNDSRFDYSSAINDTTGTHRRDFIFNGAFLDSSDLTPPGAGVDRYVFAASNNSPGWPQGGVAPVAITATGWYTLRHRFYDSGGGVLACDFEILDASNSIVASWTRSDASDIIGVTVGGNRYGWLHNLDYAFAIDNTTISVGQQAFDNCDPSPVVTFSDAPSLGCGGTGTILRTWTATDACGNESSCDQLITIVDTTDPVITCPADIEVNADAGGCDAIVAITPATATDNCAVDTIEGVRDDSLALGDPYPAGDTIITWTATDCGGNTDVCMQTITVNDVNDLAIDIQLGGVLTIPTRCIHFVLDDCTEFSVELDFDDGPGLFSGVVEIPCGAWTSLCIKDEQHTQWDTSTLSDVGTSYTGTAVTLLAGDTDNDGDVDINDVTYFVATFGDLAAYGGCPWDGVTRDADFSNNGAVGGEDYTLLTGQWLTMSSCGCILPSQGLASSSVRRPGGPQP
jgi:hypothetical protein